MDSFSLAAFRSIRLLLSVAENEKKGKKKGIRPSHRIHYWIERVSLLKELPLSFLFTAESSFRTYSTIKSLI